MIKQNLSDVDFTHLETYLERQAQDKPDQYVIFDIKKNGDSDVVVKKISANKFLISKDIPFFSRRMNIWLIFHVCTIELSATEPIVTLRFRLKLYFLGFIILLYIRHFLHYGLNISAFNVLLGVLCFLVCLVVLQVRSFRKFILHYIKTRKNEQ